MAGLDKALAIAVEAHAGQFNKAGEPYILHVLRVVLAVSTAEERVVAALHDVVEKSDEWTLDRLVGEGFPRDVVEAVDALTRREGERWEAFLARSASRPISKQVKVADLRDNLDQLRRSGSEPNRQQEYREDLSRFAAPD